jgi:hypothetical protein
MALSLQNFSRIEYEKIMGISLTSKNISIACYLNRFAYFCQLNCAGVSKLQKESIDL